MLIPRFLKQERSIWKCNWWELVKWQVFNNTFLSPLRLDLHNDFTTVQWLKPHRPFEDNNCLINTEDRVSNLQSPADQIRHRWPSPNDQRLMKTAARDRSVLINYAWSFQQARSSIDSGETHGIRWFLESWTTFRSRGFLPVARTIIDRVCTFLSLSPPLVFLPLFRRPTSLGMLMSFFRNPSAPIRGTSPARFFVSERMSRLIDEWRMYTLRCGTGWPHRTAVLTYVRGVRSKVLPCLIIRRTPRYFDGSRQILGGELCVRKTSDYSATTSPIEVESIAWREMPVEFFWHQAHSCSSWKRWNSWSSNALASSDFILFRFTRSWFSS